MDDKELNKRLEQFNLQTRQLVEAFGAIARATFEMANQGEDRAGNLTVWNYSYIAALEHQMIVMLRQLHANLPEKEYLETREFTLGNIRSFTPPDGDSGEVVANIKGDGTLEPVRDPDDTVH